MNRYLFCLLLWLIMIFAGAVPAADEFTSFIQIDEAYKLGHVDRAEMLYRKALLLFSPEIAVHDKSASEIPMLKSATALLAEVRDNWDIFSPDQKLALSSMMARPSKQSNIVSPDGYFRVHYDSTGPEAVPPQDADADLIPDYVERIALYADSSRRVNDQLGYYSPPQDGGTGGDDKYDIYLVSILAYGGTSPESPGDSSWNDYTSYILVHRNLYGFPPNDDPQGDTIGAQKVTCAHEYFHAVQLAYDFDIQNNLWWMEATATYMEEVVFPEVNDNYSYLPYFFNYPNRSIHYTNDDYHMYGAFVWPLYLSERFNASVILESWLACRYVTPFAAIDSALADFGRRVSGVFPEFTIWNYFTNDRAGTTTYYPEGPNYPKMPLDRILPDLPHDSLQPVIRPDGLGCNYIRYAVEDTLRGILEVTLEGSPLVFWGAATISFAGSSPSIQYATADGYQPIQFFIPFIEDYDSVVVIPGVVTYYLTGNYYYLSTKILPYGDANYDREVNVGDALYLVSYAFKGGPPPRPVYESGDANCDGNIDVGDAVQLIGFIFKGGMAPCAER